MTVFFAAAFAVAPSPVRVAMQRLLDLYEREPPVEPEVTELSPEPEAVKLSLCRSTRHASAELLANHDSCKRCAEAIPETDPNSKDPLQALIKGDWVTICTGCCSQFGWEPHRFRHHSGKPVNAKRLLRQIR